MIYGFLSVPCVVERGHIWHPSLAVCLGHIFRRPTVMMEGRTWDERNTPSEVRPCHTTMAYRLVDA